MPYRVDDNVVAATREQRQLSNVIEGKVLKARSGGSEHVPRLFKLCHLSFGHLWVAIKNEIQIIAALFKPPLQLFDCANVVVKKVAQIFVDCPVELFIKDSVVLGYFVECRYEAIYVLDHGIIAAETLAQIDQRGDKVAVMKQSFNF